MPAGRGGSAQMGPRADAARLPTAASCRHEHAGTAAGPVTTLTRPRAGTGNGGVPARRAVFRWGWRLFRREWRQQLLVLGLLTVAVGATVWGASVITNV